MDAVGMELVVRMLEKQVGIMEIVAGTTVRERIIKQRKCGLHGIDFWLR